MHLPTRPGPLPARSLCFWSGAVAAGVLLALLAGCAGPGGQNAPRYTAVHHRYPPPGPPGDPWGPYIREASLRFGVPEEWVRAVMRQESGGRDDAVSSAGAIGLMQVMPDTYAMLRARYGLGDDPYEPHDNIMAGTAYIRELYDQYGAPGFLAAYNAGPRRLDAYLANGTPLPDETVGYLSNIAPHLGTRTAMTGPLAVYAGPVGAEAPAAPLPPAQPPVMLARAGAGACDPDAAYDPDRPCTPTQAAAPVPAPSSAPAPAPAYAVAALPPPPSYVQPAPQPVYAAQPAAPVYAAAPPGRAILPPLVYSSAPAVRPQAQLASLAPAAPGSWAIQVGAFSSQAGAHAAAEQVRAAMPDLLGAGSVAAPPTTPFGGTVLYRARIVALSESTAASACARLSARGTACMTVPPGR
ncbi:MAG TPA: lytic transglycosylase domain-containing protein [Acetobacteraceae bacterium]|nr:lytic transglycosylase domain-containing protein [Acetobacteraceae bacterium]